MFIVLIVTNHYTVIGIEVDQVDNQKIADTTLEFQSCELDNVTDNEIKFVVRSLAIRLSKNEYQIAQACTSNLCTEIVLSEGNTFVKGRLGKITLLDLSPSGSLYKKR